MIDSPDIASAKASRYGRWFRFYERTLDNPKAQRLPAPIFKGWVNLLCLASKNDGFIPAADISFSLRITQKQANQLTRELIAADLLAEVDGGFTPHEWKEHQYSAGSDAAERQRRYRERHKNNVTRSSRVTMQESDTESETDSSAPNGAGASTATLFEKSTPSQTNGKSRDTAKPDPKKQVYDRGKEVFGESSGGIITNILKAKENKYAKALALIEDAAEKRDPVSWINAWLWEHGPPGIQVGPLSPAL